MTRFDSGRLLAVAFAIASLAGWGCVGEQGASGDDRTKLTIGLPRTHDVAPVLLGLEHGFFAAEGLDVELRADRGELVRHVLSEEVQIGFSSTPALLSAAAEGQAVEIVAPGAAGPSGAVMVRRDSPIGTYADLAGRTVAVDALADVADVTLNAALDQRGIDPAAVRRRVVPVSRMTAALDVGRVDAVLLTDPHKTAAERSGRYRSIGSPAFEVRPGLVSTTYFASALWAEQNQAVLGRFLTALRKSMRYAAQHEQEAREAIAAYSGLPDELVRAMPVGNLQPGCDELRASSELLGSLMLQDGSLEREPDLDELIPCAGSD